VRIFFYKFITHMFDNSFRTFHFMRKCVFGHDSNTRGPVLDITTRTILLVLYCARCIARVVLSACKSSVLELYVTSTRTVRGKYSNCTQ
jgi:hypothetical protein